MQTGRNASCPCGSGKKFKHCCVNKSATSLSKGKIALIAVLVLVLGGIAFLPGGDEEASSASIPSGGARFRPGPPPRGPAPPGKVWSTEHGHWHDAPTAGTRPSPIQIQQPANPALRPTVTSTPQPAGAVPPGKVWSTEHGHWHDVPPAK